MKYSYYLGIDPSLSNTAGVLLNSNGEVVWYGNSKNRENPSKPHTARYEIARLSEIASYISDGIIKALPKKYTLGIGYENYSFDSTNRAFSLGELGGVLKTSLLSISPEILLVAPTLVKKFATWRGKAGKDDMQAQALVESLSLRNLSSSEFTDDVADAYFLAKFAWYYYSPEDVIHNEVNRENIRGRLELCQKLRKSKKVPPVKVPRHRRKIIVPNVT